MHIVKTAEHAELRGEIAAEAMEQLFTGARTHNGWRPTPVGEDVLRRLYHLASLAPTSMNCQPMRLVFITTPAHKRRLLPALAPGNVGKAQEAPVVAIIAHDQSFHELLPSVWHQPGAKDMFAANEPLARATAFRNGSLQAGFLILAARALGLDAGAMSGFDAARVNQEFFPDGRWTTNFLCNFGYGNPDLLFPRQRRLDFGEACVIL